MMKKKHLLFLFLMSFACSVFSYDVYDFYDYEESEYVDDYGFSEDMDFGSVISREEDSGKNLSDEESAADDEKTVSEWEQPSLEDYYGRDFSSVQQYYRARVTEQKVNVRKQPSTSSEKVKVVYKDDVVFVRGFDDERQNVDGPGYWVMISDSERGDPSGWIYSKYLDIDHNLYSGRFSYIRTEKHESGFESLVLKLSRCYENTVYVDVVLKRNEGQDFCTFTWGPANPQFKYYDPVGTFVLNEESVIIKHVSYNGGNYDSLWSCFTDDMEFMIQDAGKSSTARALNVYETSSGQLIFSGNYYKDIFLEEDSIVVAEIYNSWNIGNGYISKESIKKAEEFKESLSAENLKKGEILVLYRLNLKTMKMEYIRCVLSVKQKAAF